MTLGNTSKTLKEIQAFDLSAWDVSFWLVKRKLRNKEAQYSVLRVNIDSKLEKRLVGYVKNQLQDRKFHIEAYDYANGDGDDTLFEMEAGATDFLEIKEAISAGFENSHVTKYDELLSSWAYIVSLENDDNKLFAWRKINSMTQPKKAKTRKATFFRDEQLIDIDDKQVFLIDPRFDFFVFEDTMFIANKKEFESSMNFREGMEKKSKAVIDDFSESGAFKHVERVSEFVGNNLRHLRKMASIHKAGYYKNKAYIENMIAVSKEKGWGLKVENNQVVIEHETLDLLLKLLNNDRLRSMINDEVFDAAAKAKVQKSKVSTA